MRFICDTNELNTALSNVSRALAVRSTKPILEGILFESCDEGLRLTCTDLAGARQGAVYRVENGVLTRE